MRLLRILSMIIGFLLGGIDAFCQQLPQYTQYLFNSFLINPALTGIENYTDIKTGYRKQWQGIQGAPETSFFSAHMPLGKKFTWDNPGSFSGDGRNPNGRSFVQDYEAAAPHHGVGLFGYVDHAGAVTTTDFNLSYAYHLGLAPKLNMAVGVDAGMTYTNVDMDKISTSQPNDIAVVNAASGKISPNVGLGVWLYSPIFFGGFSAQQLLSGSIFSSGTNQTITSIKKVPHYFLSTGLKLYVSDDVSLTPSILFKKAGPADISFDINSKATIKNRFWLGGSWRKGDSFSAMTGFYFNHFLNVGYSYDFTTSELQKATGGSHEIMLGFLLNNRYKVICPQRNW